MLDGRTQVVPQSRTRRMIERRPEWTEHDEQSASGSPNEGGQGRQFQLSWRRAQTLAAAEQRRRQARVMWPLMRQRGGER